MSASGTIGYGLSNNNHTAGFAVDGPDSTVPISSANLNIAAGWDVTAALRNGAAPYTPKFVNTKVQSVSITYDSSSPPVATRIEITLVGTFDSDDANNADNVVYTFAPPSGGPVTCFVAGTRVLTDSGYKAIETLTQSDRIVTSEGREVSAKVYSFELPRTTKTSAPYRIEAGAFGRGLPAAPIALSPIHKIQMRPHLWTSPHDAAAGGNSLVKQYGVGEPIRYYHIECENYLRDNIVAEGLVVESLGHEGRYKGVQIYTWSKRFQGYTRISADSKVAGRS